MRRIILLSLSSLVILFMEITSCNNQRSRPLPNSISFPARLTDFKIFKGKISNLVPADNFHLIELSSTLFTDYAQKQRLIYIPASTKAVMLNDELPEFPNGTILAKTFYYDYDRRKPELGRKIIETRLLVLKNQKWSLATYQWNNKETEAYLIGKGAEEKVSWNDEQGQEHQINYHIASQEECTTCHNSDRQIVPIGPKARNLNFNIYRDGAHINEIEYFRKMGLFSIIKKPELSMPTYTDTTVSLQDRARAYLDINCAHCHNPKGVAGEKKLNLGYDIPFSQTAIADNKWNIKFRTQHVRIMHMPKLGTTILDQKNVALIAQYINSLPDH